MERSEAARDGKAARRQQPVMENWRVFCDKMEQQGFGEGAARAKCSMVLRDSTALFRSKREARTLLPD
ncbi:hypothetical protein U1Q18_016712 [Sarracenia purpurea var. burkii]